MAAGSRFMRVPREAASRYARKIEGAGSRGWPGSPGRQGFALEVIAAVDRKFLARLRELEGFYEFVRRHDFVRLACLPLIAEILEAHAVEHHARPGAGLLVERVEIHESFLVEVAQHDCLTCLVVTEVAVVVVNLRRLAVAGFVAAGVVFLDEFARQSPFVRALDLAFSRVTGRLTLPVAEHESNRLPRVWLVGGCRTACHEECEQCDADLHGLARTTFLA